MLKTIALVGLVLCTAASANRRIDGGKECGEKAFPDAVNIEMEIRDRNTGKLVWESSCSGTLISDFAVLTTGHCIFEKKNLIDEDFLPLKQRERILKEKISLTLSYLVKGETAQGAYRQKGGQLGILVFKNKLPFANSERREHSPKKGESFTAVGFSPEKQLGKVKDARKKNIDDYSFEEASEEAVRVKKLLKYTKQCGTTEYTGWTLDKVKDFEGIHVCYGRKNKSCGYEHGDSGGGIYRREDNGTASLVGIMEIGGFGNFKRNADDEITDLDLVKDDEAYNGAVFLTAGEAKLLSLVQKTKDAVKDLRSWDAFTAMPNVITP